MRTESAMVLTDQEWRDLQAMTDHYLLATRWAEQGPLIPALQSFGGPNARERQHHASIMRKRALAKRIAEANS